MEGKKSRSFHQTPYFVNSIKQKLQLNWNYSESYRNVRLRHVVALERDILD